MGSRKRSAWTREKAAFAGQLDMGPGLDDLFASEGQRLEDADERRAAARREKACESKRRYATRADAEVTAEACEAHGSAKLHVYKCPYCGGWHLTHK